MGLQNQFDFDRGPKRELRHPYGASGSDSSIAEDLEQQFGGPIDDQVLVRELSVAVHVARKAEHARPGFQRSECMIDHAQVVCRAEPGGEARFVKADVTRHFAALLQCAVGCGHGARDVDNASGAFYRLVYGAGRGRRAKRITQCFESLRGVGHIMYC